MTGGAAKWILVHARWAPRNRLLSNVRSESNLLMHARQPWDRCTMFSSCLPHTSSYPLCAPWISLRYLYISRILSDVIYLLTVNKLFTSLTMTCIPSSRLILVGKREEYQSSEHLRSKMIEDVKNMLQASNLEKVIQWKGPKCAASSSSYRKGTVWNLFEQLTGSRKIYGMKSSLFSLSP